MKLIILLTSSLILISCGKKDIDSVSNFETNNIDSLGSDAEETDSGVLSPEQEAEMQESLLTEKARPFRFGQTSWRECTDQVTGNFKGYKCVKSRGISNILKSFMEKHMHKCVNAGLAAQGGGTVSDLHIEHAGILGDRNHSPRSLHAENRAIDIKAFEMKLTNGKTKRFTYKYSSNKPFYRAFRRCWGNIVKTYNACPTYKGNIMLTGSIGRENRYHKQHMHTSVPYCVRGKHGGYYYRR